MELAEKFACNLSNKEETLILLINGASLKTPRPKPILGTKTR